MAELIQLLTRPRRVIGFLFCLSAASLLFAVLPQQLVEGKAVEGQWYSVLPPLVAVSVALFFRNLVLALAAAFLTGAFLTFGLNPFFALPRAFYTFIWSNLVNGFNISIFVFLFFPGRNDSRDLSKWRHSRFSGKVDGDRPGSAVYQIGDFFAGLIIFFDDYSNTVVVGSTMRKLSDRWKISREKLAYLVDSTAAPIAGLAMLSTWIAFEVFLFSQMAGGLGLEEGGYAVFIKSVPYRFYCWGTLIFVLFTCLSNRDFGPMYRAEIRAARSGKVLRDGAQPLISERNENLEPDPGQRHLASVAAIPIIWVIGSIFTGILLIGRHRILEDGGTFSLLSPADWRNAFGYATNPAYGEAGSMLILALAAISGGILAIALAVGRRVVTFGKAFKAYWQAIPTMRMAAFILIMAWSMKEICTTGLHTDQYLISLLGNRLPVWILPLLTFFIASGIAFATGTSFGTMGILIPVILPLAYSLGAYDEASKLYFWLTAAAILDGAIFGDHCGPISDTTVLSSIATGCDHIDHVETQVVYAVSVMFMVAMTGYLAVGFGLPLWSFFTLFPLLALLLLVVIGKRVVQ